MQNNISTNMSFVFVIMIVFCTLFTFVTWNRTDKSPKWREFQVRCCSVIAYIVSTRVFRIIIFYKILIITHFIASNLYPKICTPNTIIGFLMSPLMTTTPQCICLRYIINFTGNTIYNMWFLLGTWMITNIDIIRQTIM